MRKGRQVIGRLASELGTALQIPDLPESELEWTHSSRKPAPKRRWKCPHCPTRFAFEWTMKRHDEQVHLAYLPKPEKQPMQRTGLLPCTSCHAKYNNAQEMQMHRMARHPWLETD